MCQIQTTRKMQLKFIGYIIRMENIEWRSWQSEYQTKERPGKQYEICMTILMTSMKMDGSSICLNRKRGFLLLSFVAHRKGIHIEDQKNCESRQPSGKWWKNCYRVLEMACNVTGTFNPIFNLLNMLSDNLRLIWLSQLQPKN